MFRIRADEEFKMQNALPHPSAEVTRNVKFYREGNTLVATIDGVTRQMTITRSIDDTATLVTAPLRFRGNHQNSDEESLHMDVSDIMFTPGARGKHSARMTLIGTPLRTGTISFTGTAFSMTGAGQVRTQANHDSSAFFAYTQVPLDITKLSLKITRFSKVNGSNDAGIMIRDSLDACSGFIQVGLWQSKDTSYVRSFYKSTCDQNGGSDRVVGDSSFQSFHGATLELVKVGNQWRARVERANGSQWGQSGARSVTLNGPLIYVGVYMSSYSDKANQDTNTFLGSDLTVYQGGVQTVITVGQAMIVPRYSKPHICWLQGIGSNSESLVSCTAFT